jgi:hypothetical protein
MIAIVAAALAVVLAVALPTATRQQDPAPETTPVPNVHAQVKRALFGELDASRDVREVADWVVAHADNGDLPFIIIDKIAASLYLFDAQGRAQAAAPALLGMARGDHFAPGVAEKDMYQTAVSERITPAGRFVAERGINDHGQHVIWVDYDAGIALHAVLNVPRQHRVQRLATPTPDDNRISYGCVNLPRDFYAEVLRPLFDRTRAVVYVLPDSENALELFARSARNAKPELRASNTP